MTKALAAPVGSVLSEGDRVLVEGELSSVVGSERVDVLILAVSVVGMGVSPGGMDNSGSVRVLLGVVWMGWVRGVEMDVSMGVSPGGMDISADVVVSNVVMGRILSWPSVVGSRVSMGRMLISPSTVLEPGHVSNRVYI